MAKIRLDKYLADVGLGTRSQVKDMAKKGIILVNGKVVKKTDLKIDTEEDVVKAGDRVLKYNEFEYYMLNKPAGVVSATRDDRDKTVIQLLDIEKRRDLFPVGRLDKDTEGLLLITNDGILANNLLAPGKHVSKKYYVQVDGVIENDIVDAFSKGIDIGDDKPTKEAVLEVIEGKEFREAFITITEGRYHQIKRMFEAFGLHVTYLKRLSMGNLVLDEKLLVGEYRELTDEEIMLLKK